MNSINARLKRLQKRTEEANIAAMVREAANRAAILDLQSLADAFDRRGRTHIGDIARQEIERRQNAR